MDFNEKSVGYAAMKLLGMAVGLLILEDRESNSFYSFGLLWVY